MAITLGVVRGVDHDEAELSTSRFSTGVRTLIIAYPSRDLQLLRSNGCNVEEIRQLGFLTILEWEFSGSADLKFDVVRMQIRYMAEEHCYESYKAD